jgi:antitoxin CptB
MDRNEPDDDREMRRRRLRYRAWHRGMREMDFVLGRFADAELAGLNEIEIAQFESLMDLPDPDLFAWITGTTAAPAEVETPLFQRLTEFHRTGKGALPR